MRWLLLFTTAALLLGCNASWAQVSTMGTTAMGLSSTPGAILTSPLNGPSPFSATTQAGAPDTTLVAVPLASDPTTPGTVVTCSSPIGQITPGTPAVAVTFLSPMVGTTGAMPAISTVSTTSAVAITSSTPTTGNAIVAPLTFAQQPETSSVTVLPGTTIPAPRLPAIPALPSPPITAVPASLSPRMQSTISTSMPGTTAAATSPPATTGPLGTIPTPIGITTTGNISPAAPLGSSSTTVCSSMPGGPPSNGAALPLSTPQIPTDPPPGTIQQDIAQLGGTSLDPTLAVMPTPNTAACAEGMTMNLATPGTMAPANATGAAATPGVSPPGC